MMMGNNNIPLTIRLKRHVTKKQTRVARNCRT